jgi:transposase
VVLTIDNAPWHRGRLINEVLDKFPHLKLYRLPSYSPRFNVIERLWKRLRRRATHNRFFATVADLRRALRASLCYSIPLNIWIHVFILYKIFCR